MRWLGAELTEARESEPAATGRLQWSQPMRQNHLARVTETSLLRGYAEGAGVTHDPYFVYVIGAMTPDESHYEAVKIGSSAAPARRVATLQTGNHRKLEFLHLYRFRFKDAAQYFERRLLNDCREYRVRGEWLEYLDLSDLDDFLLSKLEAGLRRVKVQAVDLTRFIALYDLSEELCMGILTPQSPVDQLDHVLRHATGIHLRSQSRLRLEARNRTMDGFGACAAARSDHPARCHSR